MKRSSIYIVLFFLIWSGLVYAESSTCPYVGAIRWDAWHGDKGPVGKYVEKDLSHSQWHYRVPFCGQILSENKVKIDCATPEAMTKEISYTEEAQLDYWAFLFYPIDNPMSSQFKLFIENPANKSIKFAFILQFGHLVPQKYNEINNHVASLVTRINYLKINNKPVVFIFNINEVSLNKAWGEAKNFKRIVLDDLIAKVLKATGTKPYFIVMDFNPETASKWADIFELSAISTYATHPGEKGSYKDLVKQDINYWNRATKTGKTVIPIVMTGWDPQPRVPNPAPWMNKKYLENAKKVFFETPTPEEIAEHVRQAIKWAKENNSPAIIIYAWNEFDEGGWIMPTLYEGDKRVKAIGKVIKEECSN